MKRRILMEDGDNNRMPNVNRNQSGVTANQSSKGDSSPQANNVAALMKSNDSDSNFEAPSRILDPLDKTGDIIADITIITMNLKRSLLQIQELLNQSKKNPKVQKVHMESVNEIQSRLDNMDRLNEKISKNVVEISAIVDNIV